MLSFSFLLFLALFHYSTNHSVSECSTNVTKMISCEFFVVTKCYRVMKVVDVKVDQRIKDNEVKRSDVCGEVFAPKVIMIEH